MRNRFGIMLMIAALFGLFGQEVVYARALPDAAMSRNVAAAATTMNPGCAEMMGLAKAQPQSPDMPCEGKSLDCMAKMGCSVPMVLLPSLVAEGNLSVATILPHVPTVARLNGLDYGPEPDPPTQLT